MAIHSIDLSRRNNHSGTLGFARLDEVELAYETFGNPEHPALLLIMGLGAQMLVWPDELCRSLAAQGYHVIRFDNRDIGLSSKFSHKSPRLAFSYFKRKVGLSHDAPYTLYDMAEDCRQLLAHLNIRRAHIAGASMGGMIAQILAARYPSLVSTLTLLMTSSGFTGLPVVNPGMALRLLRRPADESTQSILRHKVKVVSTIGSRSYPAAETELLERLQKVMARNRDDTPGARRQTAAMISTGSLKTVQGRIVAPTLVIHGDEDRLIPARRGEEVASRILRSRFELVSGMGHDFPSPLQARLSRIMLKHLNTHANIFALSSHSRQR